MELKLATFRARARALDMLGRQQIAGRPTAISELFKNAHDAYATTVEVDYYRSDGLFVLRDNGLGMTLDDFESRWLTLGTESKLAGLPGHSLPPIDPGVPERPILGEKGIGRLAIASIGPQVLILTRAKGAVGSGGLVACFINWRLFEIPGVDLNEVELPIHTYPAGSIPSAIDIERMVGEVRENIKRLGPRLSATIRSRIVEDLESFKLDPATLASELGEPALVDGGHGTHFVIKPADELLNSDIDGSGDETDVASPLIKVLIGFFNTMTPGHEPPRMSVAFRDHRTLEAYEDLISEQSFFTPEEFTEADHHIAGHFDEYGQFSGSVTVYGEEKTDHVVPWRAARGRPTDCGPFRINLAYVQGVARESALPIEQWTRIVRKLNRIGGLYIYRDGVRVLPYGNTDYDFLDIERNRTKSASYYYFSYRRIFGVIEISKTQNGSLSEKAGREGFVENRAYRQFREILKDFFVQIAADFFREGGVQAERFVARKAELDRLEIARRRRDKLITVRRSALRGRLEQVFERLDLREPEQQAEGLITTVKRDLTDALTLTNPDQAAQMFIDAEMTARRQLDELREAYRIVRPRGVGLTKQLSRDWEAYGRESDRLERDVFAPTADAIDQAVSEVATRAKVGIDLRRRVEVAINEEVDTARRVAVTESRETRHAANRLWDDVLKLTRESVAEVDQTVNNVLSSLARLDLISMSEREAVDARNRLESEIATIIERRRELLENVREQIQAIVLTPDASGNITGINETTEALEQELLSLRERAEADLELTQLGMAIGVISHEFEATIKSVRGGLRRLKGWADVNEGLLSLYSDINTSFDHLEQYLNLFTPLQRRVQRTAVEITGTDILDFIVDLFRERARRHGITVEATQRFKRFKFIGHRATFYPVFVNLVDNAMFWLRDRPGPRIIRLDADGQAMFVHDNGPGVSSRDKEAAFELGFTRKPGGRGMGLFISREVLRESKYRLDLVDPGLDSGASFKIAPSETQEDS